jgi:carbon storage regulator
LSKEVKMLVLSRKVGESVVIQDAQITVTVVDIEGDKVRLGFDAPREVSIDRQEVYDAIQRDGRRRE